ncbi:MAG: hypothetical protein KJ607_02870, partial [Bacteroidetes bacterium]|nr:hypothetical protein [Bacteroidota bacterium]
INQHNKRWGVFSDFISARNRIPCATFSYRSKAFSFFSFVFRQVRLCFLPGTFLFVFFCSIRIHLFFNNNPKTTSP